MITIDLPFPDPRLNPNRSNGKHWGSTTMLRKRAREDTHWYAKSMIPKFDHAGGDVELVITFVQPDKRRRDRDNLLAALKPSLDGLADALGINDSQFEPITLRREYGAKPGSTRIEIICK